jgi:hypothetical protein
LNRTIELINPIIRPSILCGTHLANTIAAGFIKNAEESG